ncbi:urease accessory protein UreD [Sulfurospirillum arcachonense]|uniref:urease accessory protein UreD n=1 Tax=Sulfurospirillum arcachonense TaxID=57666 RepID=UPI0004683AEC|nr:urease accessory protein UreD [Sulfurospirillum arcachonense]
MSIKFSLKDDSFFLDKLKLPSRYYYFNKQENYIKLLNIGEGIFPQDKIRTSISLNNSNLILTTESATKIYPSKKEYGINKIDINIENNSNLEFLNDELILYKDSKYIQFFNLNYDDNSTFFYSDILSRGRSFEDFDFSNVLMKNTFSFNKKLEYLEKFDVVGDDLKDYIIRKNSDNFLFLKIYITTKDNKKFLDILEQNSFNSFTYTKSKDLLIGSISSNNMNDIKKVQKVIWGLYRHFLGKNEFSLGKQ